MAVSFPGEGIEGIEAVDMPVSFPGEGIEGIEAVDMPASFPGEGIEGIEAVVQHLETARRSTSEKVQKSDIAKENMCDSA